MYQCLAIPCDLFGMVIRDPLKGWIVTSNVWGWKGHGLNHLVSSNWFVVNLISNSCWYLFYGYFVSKTSTLNKKKPATSKVFLVGTPKNQMLNPPKNLYFDNLLNSLVTHMHHATWRFYGIPFPEAQWFGLGNPKHQLAETHTSFHSQKADM